MAKLKLTANPTFKCKVQIPVPGAKPADVEFTFKGRTRDQFKEFVEGLEGRKDGDVIMDVACGWDLEDAFGPESVELLIQNYIGAGRAVISAYMTELTDARTGNSGR